MTPTSTSALSAKQSPLQIQSREITYHCSTGLQCERNQEHNYSGHHSRMTVLCSPGCTQRRKYGVVISISSFNMKIKRIHLLYHKWGNCGQEQSLIWSAAWKISFLHKTFPALLSYQVILLDGAAIVNTLRPGFAKTFSDYATHVFLPYITSQLQHVNRLDVVWDEYIADSLKAETRTRRGKGIRRRVEPSNTILGNWQEFLRINDNKIELFSFLATSAATIATDKQVISTCHTGVLCTQSRDVRPCSMRP